MTTLDSGLDVGPTFILFFKPYDLIKGPSFINFWDLGPANAVLKFDFFSTKVCTLCSKLVMFNLLFSILLKRNVYIAFRI